jgi:hypothetical protein
MLITPQRFIAPPPCWCGRGWQAHEWPPARRQPAAGGAVAPGGVPEAGRTPRRGGAPEHRYVPADGIESEAFDAW